MLKEASNNRTRRPVIHGGITTTARHLGERMARTDPAEPPPTITKSASMPPPVIQRQACAQNERPRHSDLGLAKLSVF